MCKLICNWLRESSVKLGKGSLNNHICIIFYMFLRLWGMILFRQISDHQTDKHDNVYHHFWISPHTLTFPSCQNNLHSLTTNLCNLPSTVSDKDRCAVLYTLVTSGVKVLQQQCRQESSSNDQPSGLKKQLHQSVPFGYRWKQNQLNHVYFVLP